MGLWEDIQEVWASRVCGLWRPLAPTGRCHAHRPTSCTLSPALSVAWEQSGGRDSLGTPKTHLKDTKEGPAFPPKQRQPLCQPEQELQQGSISVKVQLTSKFIFLAPNYLP